MRIHTQDCVHVPTNQPTNRYGLEMVDNTILLVDELAAAREALQQPQSGGVSQTAVSKINPRSPNLIGVFSYQNSNHRQARTGNRNAAASKHRHGTLGSLIRTVVFGVGFSASELHSLRELPLQQPLCDPSKLQRTVPQLHFTPGHEYQLFSGLSNTPSIANVPVAKHEEHDHSKTQLERSNGVQPKFQRLCTAAARLSKLVSKQGEQQAPIFVLDNRLLPASTVVGTMLSYSKWITCILNLHRFPSPVWCS